MIHIYECNVYGENDVFESRYWEVFKAVIGDPWGDEFLFDLPSEKEYQEYLDELCHDGVDFVIHNNEEGYDEYHVALPVQAS